MEKQVMEFASGNEMAVMAIRHFPSPVLSLFKLKYHIRAGGVALPAVNTSLLDKDAGSHSEGCGFCEAF